MNMSEKRKAATTYLINALKSIDSHALGANVTRYEKLLSQMSDREFNKFMIAVRDKEACIYVYMPNMTKRPKVEDLLQIAKKQGIKIFHRIKKYDSVTNKYFVTNEEYPVVRIPIRRLQQFQDKKISVPHGSNKVDSMTGQVAWEDECAALSNPEIQAMQAKGLSATLHELVAIRGGNIEAWSGDMRRQAEETGEVLLEDIAGGTTTRTAKVTQVFFDCMMLDSNIVED